MWFAKKITGVLVPKTKSQNITCNINIPEIINAPIYEGQKLRRSYLFN